MGAAVAAHGSVGVWRWRPDAGVRLDRRVTSLPFALSGQVEVELFKEGIKATIG
jgi:hypothetical protein